MVKVIAGILLFFGCTALGFSKASGYKNRRVELEDTLELIRLLHLDISLSLIHISEPTRP